jgi:hypothetical protein
MIPDKLDFTLDVIEQEIPVSIPNKNGSISNYKLVTLSAQDSTQYQNARAASIKFDSQGNPVGFNKIADLGPLLLSYCLKREDGGSVSKGVIGDFPAKVLQKLFTVAQEMNDLNQEVRYTEAMVKVFKYSGSPVDMEQTREWLESLDQSNKDVSTVCTLFRKTDSEYDLGKNS